MKLKLTARQVQIFAAMVRATEWEELNYGLEADDLGLLTEDEFMDLSLSEENELSADECVRLRIISEISIWDAMIQEFEEKFPAAPLSTDEIEALVALIWTC